MKDEYHFVFVKKNPQKGGFFLIIYLQNLF